MRRREFLKIGATGMAAAAVGTLADWPHFWRIGRAFAALPGGRDALAIEMVEVDAEMVDRVVVPMWCFRLTTGRRSEDQDHIRDNPYDSPYLPRIPGITLVALAGERIRLRLTNAIDRGGDTKGFAIPGVTLRVNGTPVSQVAIARSQTVEIEFTAPQPGTWVYLDPTNAPVNRMLGLHGVLVVLPQPVGANGTPYASPTPNVQRLFDDLGRSEHFPGHPWDSERNAVWVTNTIDPDKCRTADTSRVVPATEFLAGILPQYFTLNGKSGFFAAQHGQSVFPRFDPEGLRVARRNVEHTSKLPVDRGFHDTHANVAVHGEVGQPCVIRCVNAGLMWHSLHIHGNHLYPLSHANYLQGTREILGNLTMLDSWTLAPGDIKDMLLPFIQPPDIPPAAWPPQQEYFPLLYPMHDHNEISNTAAGGNYPHGISTHWEISAPIDPKSIVLFVDRADLRLRTGRIELEGRVSSIPPGGITLDIHAGGPDDEAIAEGVPVDAQGRWSFRGRALKVLARKGFITVVYPREDAPGGDHHHSKISRTVGLRFR